ncbi:hypothetical protein B9P99_00415 [Candidatus Marsarchaeota G1 archaeon OSP_B]|jgi:Archaea bacterial proteins of unknown function.|uniref:AAA domain-containing protein n=3 Tax=Candidatus Marsarchaeota group 1 TaxID=2203770 RepID=A0A2R6AA80_9ARCH|nr:MAG: hypothetical protein B9Q01_05420 [Candidatus Marsarchaeota G1 archaeon OSP_D]PSN88305.1 MAG: hypothetical protein B9Q00_05900 [Candidatus Marsarchaeota G1 archaeon OSP_C]PSN96367.1 MAG: hypothetical protein B9P99_00415 [Candidatus Marsarchaeota G1 archaeon OSP_B]
MKTIISIIHMMVIVTRQEDLNRWKNTGSRVLVYGRRKSGKSFFVKNFTSWDEYFFVKRDGGILDTRRMQEISYEFLKEYMLRSEGKRFVIDEFQRLPSDFLDFLHAYHETLKVTLISSTLWLSSKFLGRGSPLLGVFEEFRMGLIDERDVLRFLFEREKGSEVVEKAVYMREPWIIPMVNGEMRDEISRIISEQKNTFASLIEEIFSEEDRLLKESYMAVLTAVSTGKVKSTEISSYLFSRKLIKRDDPSTIQSYLKILEQMGLIEKVHVINRRYKQFKVSSPVLDLYFYLEGKYGFSELEVPQSEIRKVVDEKTPRYVEDFIRTLLSKLYGEKAGKIVEKDYEIDIVLSSFRSTKLVGEVKWKSFVGKHEIRRVEEVLERFNCERVLVVPDFSALEREPKNIRVLDSSSLRDLLLRLATL